MHNFDNSDCHDLRLVKQLLNHPEDLADYLRYRPCFNAIQAVKHINLNQLMHIAAELNELLDMSTSIELYRSVILDPNTMEPDLNDPGMCWTDDYERSKQFGNDLIDELDDYVNCIMTASFNIEDVDWIYSVACRLEEPDEHEIRVFAGAKPISIEYEVL